MSTDFAALAQAIRERIAADTELLDHVLKMWAGADSAPSDNSLDALVPIAHIEVATNGKITLSQARWIARNRHDNGFADAFTKLGRTLYIDLHKFKALMSGKGGGA